MKRLFWVLLLLTPMLVQAQATIGYHRVNQVLARSNAGAYVIVEPYATIAVTSTATGLAATIYSDPLLTAPISPSVVTADASGNYDYYIPLGYCVTETIAYPGSGGVTIPNVCVISGTTTGTNNNGTTGQLAYYAANGNTLSGESFATLAQGGTGATTATGAWTNIVAGVGTQSANTFWAGPATGIASAPTFRTLVSADIPNNAANTTGNANTATTATTAATANALSAVPTQCTAGQFSTGIAASGNANCGTPTSGIVQLNGDVLAGPGSGNQAATLATVNAGPGLCGDSTHICQVTTNGKGLVTAQAAVALSATTTPKTCNANGCYRVNLDGTIEEWGASSTVSAPTSAQSVTITFPLAFNSTTHLQIVTSASSNATGDGSPHAADCHVTLSTVATSGATAIIAAVVQIGGSGYSNLAAGDYCSWHAFGD